MSLGTPRLPPPAPYRSRQFSCAPLGNAALTQKVEDGLGAFALLESEAAQFAPYPLIQASEPGAALRIAEVRHPPRQKTVQFPDDPLK